ncbi:MAG TPA: bi-domain-containing oxidoreductase [Bacteroidia bacterium]|nr:bi-domain-containing oxidoreductase [Bacteroidia bacterium]
MEQLTQNLKDGFMQVLEVPFPALSSGCVLVRNHYSLISAGTEGKTVKDARLGLLGKARARKDEVKKVIAAARTFGVLDTYKMVMNKLNSPSPLGYSCAGEVIAVADDVSDFKVGDYVACGGGSANHAEVVSVPVNLCVHIDKSVPLEFAAFTTLGAIALQGIRQADVRLGENCAVIGLGLIGQLSMQMLKAAGVKAIGIDMDEQMVELARKNGSDLSFERKRENLEQLILNITDGFGCDAVIITAGTDSLDPIDLAGKISRKKGTVVVVGAVPTGFKREHYFKKEISLKMSSSYGPGRYDPEYEEHGIDYPYAYVRWTENRNMQAFAEMLRTNQVKPANLLTHTFPFRDARQAYELILDKSETYAGIVLKYDTNREINSVVRLDKKSFNPAEPNIGLIGAGGFGQNFLIPAMKDNGNFVTVVTARPQNARNIADKFNFSSCSGDANDIFNDSRINTIFIATRHDSHAEYVLKGLKAGKHVFVEKPLCLFRNELDEIRSLYEKSDVRLMIGFNRRFAPQITELKKVISSDMPLSINYRINAGAISKDHWIQDPKLGGGRVIGEVCHFIDLCTFLTSSKIISLNAVSMDDNSKLNDTLAVSLQFENGSIAQISYFSNGNKSLAKERIEVFGSGLIAILDDFKSLTVYGAETTKTPGSQDKGHKAEVKLFLEAIRNNTATPIPFDELYHSTLATFKVLESLALNGASVRM